MKTKQEILKSWQRMSGSQISAELKEYFNKKKKTADLGTPKGLEGFKTEEDIFDDIFSDVLKIDN